MNSETKKPIANVLVIDDEAGQRDMLVFGLSERGYLVTTAASGEDAIVLAAKAEFALAICDMKMTGINGVETVKAVKKLQPNMEITIATGYATLENAIESYERGVYDYISKPYDLNELCGILERALERRKQRLLKAA